MPPESDVTDAPDDEIDTPAPTGQAPAKPETDWKSEARKWQDRAKANHGAAKELEDLKKAGMTDLERQVNEAKKAARTETLAEVGQSRAEDAIRFSVGARLPEAELDELLGDLNLARFLTEDGQVDRKKVASYVARIAPDGKGTAPIPDLGQGGRGASKGTDMNALIRRGAGFGQ